MNAVYASPKVYFSTILNDLPVIIIMGGNSAIVLKEASDVLFSSVLLQNE